MAKEIKRVITLRITQIIKTDSEHTGLATKEEFAKNFGKAIKIVAGADDVVIDNVQDFELDKE